MRAESSNTDLVDVIIDDHRAVEQIFSELQEGSGSPQHRRALVDHVIAELVRHLAAEEQCMYPAVRRRLLGGDEIADNEIAEHAEVEELMASLDGLDPADPDFESLLTALMHSVRHHVAGEESDLLPNLSDACSNEELVELGAAVLRAKATAPTRPHPNAPDRPPANRIIDPGVGLVDKIRDALSSRNV